MSIHTASFEMLALMKGIGPVIAKCIISMRDGHGIRFSPGLLRDMLGAGIEQVDIDVAIDQLDFELDTEASGVQDWQNGTKPKINAHGYFGTESATEVTQDLQKHDTAQGDEFYPKFYEGFHQPQHSRSGEALYNQDHHATLGGDAFYRQDPGPHGLGSHPADENYSQRPEPHCLKQDPGVDFYRQDPGPRGLRQHPGDEIYSQDPRLHPSDDLYHLYPGERAPKLLKPLPKREQPNHPPENGRPHLHWDTNIPDEDNNNIKVYPERLGVSSGYKNILVHKDVTTEEVILTSLHKIGVEDKESSDLTEVLRDSGVTESRCDDKQMLPLLPKIQPHMIPDYVKPFIVFVNVKGGGCQGLNFITPFWKSLNPRQVFNLEIGGLLSGLYEFRNIPYYKILVCSDDSTVGWVLSCLDNAGQVAECQSLPVAIVPMDIGNDLTTASMSEPNYTKAEEPLDQRTVVSHLKEKKTKRDLISIKRVLADAAGKILSHVNPVPKYTIVDTAADATITSHGSTTDILPKVTVRKQFNKRPPNRSTTSCSRERDRKPLLSSEPRRETFSHSRSGHMRETSRSSERTSSRACEGLQTTRFGPSGQPTRPDPQQPREKETTSHQGPRTRLDLELRYRPGNHPTGPIPQQARDPPAPMNQGEAITLTRSTDQVIRTPDPTLNRPEKEPTGHQWTWYPVDPSSPPAPPADSTPL